MPLDLTNVDLKALVERRHPDYAENIEHWQFCELSYKGGRAWFEGGNLFQFYKEGDIEYKDRLKRTYRANHTKRVVDTINQFLFKADPLRADAVHPTIKKWWKKASRTGQPIERFVSEIDQWLSVFGQLYIVMDRPPQKADLKKEEKLPYAYIVFPQHMLDMAYDDEGEMLWCLIAEDKRDDGSPTGSGACVTRWRMWTREEWVLFEPDENATGGEVKIRIAERGPHNLGKVPVITVSEGKGSRYSAPGLISDIVYMDRTLVNYGSMLDEIIYQQTFSQLTLPSEAVLPGTNEMGQIIAAGSKRVFLYNGASGGKPEYISPDPKQAGLIGDAMKQLMQDIYAVTGTDHEANSQSMSTGKSYASGKARQFDYSAIENMLIGKSAVLERAEDAMMALGLKWMGESDEVKKDWVIYPDKFDVRGLGAELEMGKELSELAPPAEVMRIQMKAIVEKMFPRLTPDEKKALMAAIDRWTPDYQKMAELKDREVGAKETTADASMMGAETGAKAAENLANQPAPAAA